MSPCEWVFPRLTARTASGHALVQRRPRVAAFIDGGGLGTIILIGIDQEYAEKILVGGILTAFLAISFDLLLTWAEKSLVRWQ